MNKQQLAAKIWESANQMRSKIEANEYKDYILGFIFYKYLSETQLQFATKEQFTEEDIKALDESDQQTVNHFKKNLEANKKLNKYRTMEGFQFKDGLGNLLAGI